jgi:hypothetical protein
VTQLNTIAFRIVPSPNTNDHEVKIFVDGRDFIARHWPDMMGMDPDDVLSYRELLPRDESHEATVIRCGCGVVGCGSVWVRISTKDDHVIWDSWQRDKGNPPAGTLVFSHGQYTQAVRDAVEDHSWETPDRTAARILGSLVDHGALATHSLKYQWASGRIRDSTLAISLALQPSDDQIVVHIPWNEQTPDEIAREAAALLKTDPNGWPDVVWYGQKTPPPFTGPAWRSS